ncbi:hypothetical protein D5S17_23095 [Pseudonocardiaceae bacterium YIM PH 21723]|nr:hypothetical protein D5S17_23095 [Pseudonocardiaceae bacterium YIM PH 21723]
MHIAFFSMPGHGHVNPLLGMVSELVRRGHRVSFGTTGTFAPRVEQAGATAVVYESLLPDEADPGARWPTGMAGIIPLMIRESRLVYPQVVAAFAGDLPDVVVSDDSLGGGRLMAEVLGIPGVQVWPFFTSGEHWRAPMELPDDGSGAAWLTELGLGGYDDYVARSMDGGIVLLPREFQYAGDTFGERFHFVGPCLTERAFQGDWPHDDRPLAYVSLGTAFNDRPDFYRTCFAALGDLPWRVVISVGQWLDIDALGPVPANVEVHRRVPQLKVLERADVFVTHAGMGSTMEALYFGVPIVAVPQAADQPMNAARIAELGLGVVLDAGTVTAAQLRAAVLAARRTPELIAMRAAVRSAGGASAAAEVIEAAAR